MGHGDYERLTPEAIDQVWLRMRAGQAAKPTARELGLCTGTVRAYLLRCGGIRPEPRRRAAGPAESGGAGGDLPRPGRRPVDPGDRGGAGQGALDDQPGGQRQRRPAPLPGRAGGPGGVVAGDPAEGVQAGRQPGAACHRGGEAGPSLVPAADRRLAEADLPEASGDAGVAREHLPHPLRAVPRRAAQGADPVSAHRPGDPPPERSAAARRPRRPAEHAAHLRTAAGGRGPSGARALGRRPGLRQGHEPGRHPGGAQDPVPDAGRAARRQPPGRRRRRRARRRDHHPARPSSRSR